MPASSIFLRTGANVAADEAMRQSCSTFAAASPAASSSRAAAPPPPPPGAGGAPRQGLRVIRHQLHFAEANRLVRLDDVRGVRNGAEAVGDRANLDAANRGLDPGLRKEARARQEPRCWKSG